MEEIEVKQIHRRFIEKKEREREKRNREKDQA
jgi:hypothetical protein